MSDTTKHDAEREPLQFDTAEPAAAPGAAPASLSCTVCKTDISTSYYEANGAIVCPSCRQELTAELTGGSASRRFATAAGLGLLAAAAGSALYYAIAALTGYEIGLVAIAVGFMVGKAVNRGSQGRGGRPYQVLAVGLTYLAIVTTYVPFITRAFQDNAGVQALIVVARLLALAIAAPILAGFQNIIGIVIIGFALFEAWRLNMPLHLAVTGPYRVGAKRGGDTAGDVARG